MQIVYYNKYLYLPFNCVTTNLKIKQEILQKNWAINVSQEYIMRFWDAVSGFLKQFYHCTLATETCVTITWNYIYKDVNYRLPCGTSMRSTHQSYKCPAYLMLSLTSQMIGSNWSVLLNGRRKYGTMLTSPCTPCLLYTSI